MKTYACVEFIKIALLCVYKSRGRTRNPILSVVQMICFARAVVEQTCLTVSVEKDYSHEKILRGTVVESQNSANTSISDVIHRRISIAEK